MGAFFLKLSKAIAIIYSIVYYSFNNLIIWLLKVRRQDGYNN